MLSEKNKQEFYQALIDKNTEYECVFFVGVKTTGVFCRPTCGARKPKFENCEFFKTAQAALLASYRPCLRCRPLSHPNHVSDLVRTLVEAIILKKDGKLMILKNCPLIPARHDANLKNASI